ncbi:biopolymer transporter ExbD [Pontibacter sp. JH31]|uniref:Biopolymer transporter ExbD n=1 Tax=Pontibacter aquaedesilientis TaxID=2766980 RepID=A0ABR7XEM6_9BACT|nr:biopolymer transporter ExbD [Pontibacter aquaedesilientis]MBD1396361.1 biopolymer transporter ExbD [Pontibacter aquaedesilientis]
MAQIQKKQTGAKGGKRSASKTGIHLDMTPMVDLAFLLLTFFMLTTTFAKPQTMEINMPANQGVDTPIAGKNAMTVILGEKNRIYYYFGFPGDEPEVVETDFSATGIRQVLLSDRVKANRNMVVLMKAMETSRYKNLVDALDELKITDTRKFALVKLTDEDRKLVAGINR